MTMLAFFEWINGTVLYLPATVVFLGAAILLTIKLRFIQIRLFPRFVSLVKKGIASSRKKGQSDDSEAINQFHAMFTAMGTTIGMGNIVGSTVAIFFGGPGALFWLVMYIFFASATKYVEVCFALHTRKESVDGKIVGGPMEYLKAVHPFFARWYAGVMLFLFAGFCSLQANTLASVWAQEGFQEWHIGLALVILVSLVVYGGAERIGFVASRLVPSMFFLYITFALLILFKDISLLYSACALVFNSIFVASSAMGGFMGASVLKAIQYGTYKGVYISEAGLGTSSIPHAMAKVKNPTDQGILALYSMISDALLSTISGLLVLVTGVWITGDFRSTLIYEAFKMNSPFLGRFILLTTITLFVITTIIGNTFNGMQTFASITRHRWVRVYIGFVMAHVLIGSVMESRLAWEIMETLLTLVAVPHLLCLVYLTFKKPEVLKV